LNRRYVIEILADRIILAEAGLGTVFIAGSRPDFARRVYVGCPNYYPHEEVGPLQFAETALRAKPDLRSRDRVLTKQLQGVGLRT
jgi:hypothetical protein